MRVVKAGGYYFGLVFVAGFALGGVRVLWLVPRWGERWAELAETPLMLAVSYAAARGTVRRFALAQAAWPRLGVGLIALALLLSFEFGLVLRLRGLTLAEYFAARDPISTTAYYLALALFALFPLLVARRP